MRKSEREKEQARVEAAFEEGFRIQAAVDYALGAIKHVHGPVDDMPDWPEAWESDKPFANVNMEGDDGDPSVGIQGWSGLCLTPDQTGTVLGDILTARRDPALRQALLSLSPYADPNDDPDSVRRAAALLVYKALGLE